MTAELLREAAALMRERAEAATPGMWEQVVEPDGDEDGPNGEWAPLSEVAIYEYDGHLSAEISAETSDDAAHIASWHPAVALAVADWLDNEAAAVDSLAAAGVARQFDSAWVASETDKRHGYALAVARNYLGRP